MIFLTFFKFLYRILRSIAIRLIPKELIYGQIYSNRLLKRYGQFFTGDIVNVSGWDDRDIEGGVYRDYFPNRKRYLVTNAGTATKGFGSLPGYEEALLDLEQPLPTEFTSAFDVVLNVCTLEHVYDIHTSFKNLCDMSRDAVVLIVPGIQQIHIADYGDYWRMTPLAVYKKFKEHGFTPLVIQTNDQPFYPVYVFAIAVRDERKYRDAIPQSINLQMGAALFGSSLKERFIPDLLKQ